MTTPTVRLVHDDLPGSPGAVGTPPRLVAVESVGAVPVPTVAVLAKDPVSYGGLCGAFRDRDEVRLLPHADSATADVVVVACDEADARTIGMVGTLTGRGARVVLVAPDLDSRGVDAVVRAGVTVAVARREATDDRLREAVGAAAAGQCSLPSQWVRRTLSPVPGAGSGDEPRGADSARAGRPRLTRRELSILDLLADGRSTAEIARRLAYSESTIKTVVHELTMRLGVRNRSHAVAYAVRAGLI